MSNYHILSQDIKRKSVQVVFHVPIPTGTNAANISWQNAVLADLGGADNINSILSDIDAPELAALKSGALIEVRVTAKFSSINLTDAQRLNEIKAEFAKVQIAIASEKQITLAFIGMEGDI